MRPGNSNNVETVASSCLQTAIFRQQMSGFVPIIFGYIILESLQKVIKRALIDLGREANDFPNQFRTACLWKDISAPSIGVCEIAMLFVLQACRVECSRHSI